MKFLYFDQILQEDKDYDLQKQGIWLSWQTYALPTKDKNIQTLSLEEIKKIYRSIVWNNKIKSW